ncbi:hypothetical protein [Rhodococcoides fascians]|uniref:hypothetical protein n=1 Tax=Rhodococcoides fascians TaxID=1828 RepID=UPI00050CEB85|nr:hypothetical protein [Rhodococcus fascians]
MAGNRTRGDAILNVMQTLRSAEMTVHPNVKPSEFDRAHSVIMALQRAGYVKFKTVGTPAR